MDVEELKGICELYEVAVYAAVQAHGYHDISIRAETVPDRGRPRGFWVPDFMKRQGMPTGRIAERRR